MLLLLDIDGTLLIGASTEHAVALMGALGDVHGVALTEHGVATAGRTDVAIGRDIAWAAGVDDDAFDFSYERWTTATCERYAASCPDDLTHAVAPGVPEALAELQRDGHTLSLVTGNLQPVARLKLAAAGIGHFFAEDQGGFGSDAEERDALPTIARLRAGAWPRDDTVVIGDTPLDIACARADGVRVIAVTTGAYDAEALAAADVVVSCAAELPAAVASL